MMENHSRLPRSGRFGALVRSRLVLAFGLVALAACGGPSNEVRPTVSPRPVTIVNGNGTAYTARLTVGLEPSGETTVAPNSCSVLQPPAGRSGELRVQALDADQNMVVDLYGERLLSEWGPCSCSAGSFEHCVRIPTVAPVVPPMNPSGTTAPSSKIARRPASSGSP